MSFLTRNRCREKALLFMLENELSGRGRARVMKHLARCAHCRQLKEEHLYLKRQLLDLPPAPVPSPWPPLPDHPAVRRLSFLPPVPVKVFAFCCLALLVTLAVLNPGSRRPTRETARPHDIHIASEQPMPNLEDYYLLEGLPEQERQFFLRLANLAENGFYPGGETTGFNVPETFPAMRELEDYFLFEGLPEEERRIFLETVSHI